MTPIHIGGVYWLADSDPDQVAHPHVVITINGDSVTACAVTSNLHRAKSPGNVLLTPGEANLPRQSVIEVAKVVTLHQRQLGDYIGTLDSHRVEAIHKGQRFIERSYLQR